MWSGGFSASGPRERVEGADEVPTRGDRELLEDVLQVVLHRVLADEEGARDLRVSHPLEHAADDLRLPPGDSAREKVRAHVLERQAGALVERHDPERAALVDERDPRLERAPVRQRETLAMAGAR